MLYKFCKNVTPKLWKLWGYFHNAVGMLQKNLKKCYRNAVEMLEQCYCNNEQKLTACCKNNVEKLQNYLKKCSNNITTIINGSGCKFAMLHKFYKNATPKLWKVGDISTMSYKCAGKFVEIW